MFENIILWQIYLKEILAAIGEIEVIRQNYRELNTKINDSINKISDIKKLDPNMINSIKDDFIELKKGIAIFLNNFIKKEYE